MAKYIDAEKLIAEIERNRQAMIVLNKHTIPEQMSKTCAIFQYSDSILSELLSFIDTLSEEHDKSMEEAAEEYVTTHLRNNEFPTADSAFIAGAEWQKEQMMKGAVEGNVIICYLAGDGTQYGNIVSTDIDVDSHNLNEGDKIRVIIVKED